MAQTNKNLEDSCNDLIKMINVAVEEGERDRRLLTNREAAQVAADADWAEIRRILDHLFSQQSNGNGNGKSETV